MTADITIIGAGIIGLAIASELGDNKRSVYVLEKNGSHGMGISSRNSEVIHAGIYYPQDSLKAQLCVEGRELLYKTCGNYHIPYQKTGKLIIAKTSDEVTGLETLMRNAENNSVPVSFLDQNQIKTMEPNINACGAIFSPETGIINVHALMNFYLNAAKKRGVEIAFKTEVTEITVLSSGYKITTIGADGQRFDFMSETVVNAAGLSSDTIANMIGGKYRLHYCKGDYFSIANAKKGIVQRLVYPLPEKNHVGLGVHLTLDLSGRMRLGPDSNYIDRGEDYRVDAKKRDRFYESAVKFLPFIRKDDIVPDMSGIRPKLQGRGDSFHDFVIQEDLPGFVNLVGIESPGLTAAPAIARRVGKMLKGRL